jgi:hypothetical protein
MITVLLILVCLLAVVAFIQFGALIEMFQQLHQVRRHLDMFDTPGPIDLGVSQGLPPSELGLPAQLDGAEQAVVLFLSDKCKGCFDIAATLAGSALPPGLWVMIVPVTGGDASEFVERYLLRGERIMVDLDELVAGRLGLDVTPAALIVKDGRLDAAQTVPSPRQLYAMLPAPTARRLLVPRSAKAELAAHE